jgi:hypothetical protein
MPDVGCLHNKQIRARIIEGGLKDKVKSFTVDKLTKKESELFVKCWQHNLDWSKTFLDEYAVTKSRFGTGSGIRLTFNYGVKQVSKFLKKCESHYDYNLPAFIKDAKEGKIKVASLPFCLIYKVLT